MPRPPLALTLLLSLAASGCMAVKPWERERLARRSMTERFGEAGLAGQYQAKALESVTGGGLPGDAPGGGCGCTQ